MNLQDSYRRKRLALARIAREEGALPRAGDERMAGPAIEQYLAVFREAFNRNGKYDKYTDRRVGYPWCCAFVYYCCRQAGFTFPPKPIPEHRWTLGVVRVWYDWAMLPENNFYFPASDPARVPKPGDLVLFDHLLEAVEFDHIGIVLAATAATLTTAEGNYHNRSGVFTRARADCIHGYIRLNRF